jgi:hypothetical protein
VALREIEPSYFGTTYPLKTKSGQEQTFSIGRVVLTVVGEELLRIANAVENEEYRTDTLAKWNQQGWELAGQIPSA